MFARKRLPDELVAPFSAFQVQAERLEQARQALLGCLPVGRVAPVPVPVGLDLLVDEMGAVEQELSVWRMPQIEPQWRACCASFGEARSAVPHARAVAEESGELEELLDAVGEVVEPLDAWHVAERHWLALRVRRR